MSAKSFSLTADREDLDRAIIQLTGLSYAAALSKVDDLWRTDPDLYYEYVGGEFAKAFGLPVEQVDMLDHDSFDRYRLIFPDDASRAAFMGRHFEGRECSVVDGERQLAPSL